MTNENYSQLCDMIADVAGTIFDDEKEPCQFEDDEPAEPMQEFNQIWEGRS